MSDHSYSVALAFRRLWKADHVCEDPVAAGHETAQLSIPDVARVDERSLAVLGNQQSTLERRLIWIVRREQRRVVRVPRGREVEPALLHPTGEVSLLDLVREREERMR